MAKRKRKGSESGEAETPEQVAEREASASTNSDPLAFMDRDSRALSTVRQYVTNLRKKKAPDKAYIRKFILGVCEAVEKA